MKFIGLSRIDGLPIFKCDLNYDLSDMKYFVLQKYPFDPTSVYIKLAVEIL